MWRHQEKTAKNRSPQGSSSIKALPLEAQAHKQKDKRYIPGLGGNKPTSLQSFAPTAQANKKPSSDLHDSGPLGCLSHAETWQTELPWATM